VEDFSNLQLDLCAMQVTTVLEILGEVVGFGRHRTVQTSGNIIITITEKMIILQS
jgi:hypothetical protein